MCSRELGGAELCFAKLDNRSSERTQFIVDTLSEINMISGRAVAVVIRDVFT